MIRDELVAALRQSLVALDVQPLPDVINLERPARREHGDWSSNVALASAKTGRPQPPRTGASDGRPSQQRPAGPRLEGRHRRAAASSTSTWRTRGCTTFCARWSSRATIGSAGPTSAAAAGSTSSSSRPTPPGPIHAGHARGAVFGDSVGPPARTMRLRRDPRVLSQRPRQSDANISPRRSPPASGASRCPRAATRVPTSRRGRQRCPTTSIRSNGATPARCATNTRYSTRRGSTSMSGRASARSSVRARSRRRCRELRERGMVYDEDGAIWLRSSDVR